MGCPWKGPVTVFCAGGNERSASYITLSCLTCWVEFNSLKRIFLIFFRRLNIRCFLCISIHSRCKNIALYKLYIVRVLISLFRAQLAQSVQHSLRAGWSGDRIPVEAWFSEPLQAVSLAHPASYTTGLSRGKSGRGVALTTHPI